MKKIEVTGTIYARKDYLSGGYGFDFTTIKFDSTSWDDATFSGWVKVAPYTIEMEAPDNVDDLVFGGMLKGLQVKRKLILAQNQANLNEVDREIAEMQAIELKSEAV